MYQHPCTVKRILHKNDVKGCRARKKPLLRRVRLKFAKGYPDKDLTLWKHVPYSLMRQKVSSLGTTIYVMFGEGKIKTIPTVKHGRVVSCCGDVLLQLALANSKKLTK